MDLARHKNCANTKRKLLLLCISMLNVSLPPSAIVVPVVAARTINENLMVDAFDQPVVTEAISVMKGTLGAEFCWQGRCHLALSVVSKISD